MPGPSFRDLAALFLDDRRLYSVNPRTIRSTIRVLNRAFGDLPAVDVSAKAIRAWIGARLDQGVSRATLNRNRAGLSVIFNWAINEGLMPGPNPIRRVPRFREGPGRGRYLTPEEADRLVLAASPHLKPALTIGLYTGARLSEILRLTWGDVDLDAGVVTLRRETTKGQRRSRVIPVTPRLRSALLAVRRGRPDQTVCAWNDGPLRSIKRAFATARRKAGLGADVTMHVLRHTFATWWRLNGGSIEDLMEMLGHSDIKLTLRYAHFGPEARRLALRFIGPPRRQETEGGEGG